jgi:hypothetical protein
VPSNQIAPVLQVGGGGPRQDPEGEYQAHGNGGWRAVVVVQVGRHRCAALLGHLGRAAA